MVRRDGLKFAQFRDFSYDTVETGAPPKQTIAMDLKELEIRRLKHSDAPAIFEAVQESVSDVSTWMDWCHADYSLEDAQEWIGITNEGFKDSTQYDFGIFGANRYLGQVGVNRINHQARYANLGYWVRTSATGRGVAPVAVRLLTDWAFANTDLQRLEIVVALGNERSLRVAEKTGAVREGILRSKVRVLDRFYDAVIYSIVRGDL